MNALGRHILVEYYDCNLELLNDVEFVERIFVEAAEKAKATIVKSVFHKFSPHGVSGVVVIAESHIAIHSWPEYGYAAVDIFTCGNSIDPWVIFKHIKDNLQARWASRMEMHRGQFDEFSDDE